MNFKNFTASIAPNNNELREKYQTPGDPRNFYVLWVPTIWGSNPIRYWIEPSNKHFEKYAVSLHGEVIKDGFMDIFEAETYINHLIQQEIKDLFFV